jgi:RNA polymerase-binding protein DksA
MLRRIKNRLFLIQQKRKLSQERDHLKKQIAKIRKFPQYGTSEDANVQEIEKVQENLSLRKNLQTLLEQTEKALKKIDNGTYGFCENCNEPIDPGRLKAFPEATTCLKCTSKPKRT